MDKKHKKYICWGTLSTICGFIVIVIGVIRYIWGKPQPGINLSTLQPVIIDGTKTILIGAVLFIGGAYRLIYKRQGFKELEVIENKTISEEIKKDKKSMKTAGFGNREIRKKNKL